MKITILGKPIPQMRPRYYRRGNSIVVYDPQSKEKEAIKKQISKQLSDMLRQGNLKIDVEASNLPYNEAYIVEWCFHLPISDSSSTAERNAKLWGLQLPNCKPDYDNLEKLYGDVANGILWPDDSMIIAAHAYKHFSEVPRMELTITPIKKIKLSPKKEKIACLFSPSQMKELIQDAKEISSLTIPDLEIYDSDTLQAWFATTTSILNQFANKYATLLKKVEKIGMADE